MVSNFEEIAKALSSKKGVDKEVMESISTFVFDEAFTKMFEFDDLIVNLEGFCTFFYSKKRLNQLKVKILGHLDNKETAVKDQKIKAKFLADMKKEELEELLTKVDKLLNRYDEYITEKNILKAKREAYKQGKGQLS